MFKNIFGSKQPETVETSEEVIESVVSDDLQIEPEGTIENTTEVTDVSYLLTAPEIVGWLSTEEQELLFSALLLFYSPNQSILDVGCGRADLFGYLNRLFSGNMIQYKGIDLNPNLINLAKDKFPEVAVENLDILNTDMGADYDWVVGSGLFNLNDHPDMVEYAKQVIDKMYDKAKAGVSFNLLTGFPPDMAEEDMNQLIVHSPSMWLDYLIEKYSKVICRADYMSGDVTFFIFK
jgi:SAM-dependent methyltransferase